VWEARQWKRLHQGAVRRIEELQVEHRRQLQYQTERAEERERSLVHDLEYARGRIRDLEQRLFGRKSERQRVIDAQHGHRAAAVRGRGQQRGARDTDAALESVAPARGDPSDALAVLSGVRQSA